MIVNWKKCLKNLKNCVKSNLQIITQYDIIRVRKGVLSMANYTAQQIADWFLTYNQLYVIDEEAEMISNLKLQKLLYYAQGTYLGIKGEKLFEDPILAWKHGPVVETIYYKYKSNGCKGIPAENIDVPDIDPETRSILKSVYETFGQFSAWKLRDMTHEETPWQKTVQSEVIDTNLIKDYFLENYIEA